MTRSHAMRTGGVCKTTVGGIRDKTLRAEFYQQMCLAVDEEYKTMISTSGCTRLYVVDKIQPLNDVTE